MTVRRLKGGGAAVVHCRGRKKGKIIKGGKHPTLAAALKQHAAIQISKKKRGRMARP